jgi:hypothetical protein
MAAAMLAWILFACAVAYGLARVFAGYPARAERFRRLSRREAATIDAAAEAMFPPGGPIPASGLDAGSAGYADLLLDASHPRVRFLMRLLYFFFEHATLFFPAPGGLSGLRRFSSLPYDARVAWVDAWEQSRLFLRRLCFTSLRAILTEAYFSHPPVVRALGLAPFAIRSPICEADLLYPRVGAPRESIPYTRADLTPPSDGRPLDRDGPLHPRFAGEAP